MQVLLRVLNALADGVRNFGGLAQAEAHDAVAVADNHQGGEFEDAAALHGFGNTVDGNNPLLQFQRGSVNLLAKTYSSLLRT